MPQSGRRSKSAKSVVRWVLCAGACSRTHTTAYRHTTASYFFFKKCWHHSTCGFRFVAAFRGHKMMPTSRRTRIVKAKRPSQYRLHIEYVGIKIRPWGPRHSINIQDNPWMYISVCHLNILGKISWCILIIPMGRMLMASDGITHPRYKNAISTWKTMASYWSYWLSRNSTPLIISN